MNNTKKWPRHMQFAMLFLTLIFAVTIYLVYLHTREAYRLVGFNDGQIHQREQLMIRIKKSMLVGDCKDIDFKGASMQFLSVKTEAIYAHISEDGNVRFCQ